MASPASFNSSGPYASLLPPAYSSLQPNTEAKPSLLQRLKKYSVVKALLKVKNIKRPNNKKNKANSSATNNNAAEATLQNNSAPPSAPQNTNDTVRSIPTQEVPPPQDHQKTSNSQLPEQEHQTQESPSNPQLLGVMGFIPLSTPPPAAACAQRRTVDSFFGTQSSDSLGMASVLTAHTSGFGTPLERVTAISRLPNGTYVKHFVTSAGSPRSNARSTMELLDGATMALERLVGIDRVS